ncbi:MAG TPA: hypothetical protein ENI79_06750, partial [Rhodospirillales bacterium]|nr:hypothetical protein [Rhodospirillales bacterium]
VGDGEAGAEVYCVANDRSQTKRVFEPALAMATKSAALAKRIKAVPSRYRLVKRDDMMSYVQALSCELRIAEGVNAHAVFVDELHSFDERGRKRFYELRFADCARAEPLFVVISTAGDNELGIGYEQYEFSKSVLAGTREDITHFVYIAEPKEGEKPGSVEAIASANPLLNVTVQLDEIQDKFKKSDGRPGERNQYLRYRENRWIKQSADPWLRLKDWDACDGEFEPSPGDTCFGGLDLAAKYDLSAWSMCFPLGDDEYAFTAHFWLPEEHIQEREQNDRLPYRKWVDDGWMTLTPGPTTDYEFIEQRIADDAALYDLIDFGFDPCFARRSAQRLQDEFGLTLFEFAQTPGHYTEPCKLFAECVKARRLRHDGNPLLRVHASQVAVRSDAGGRIMPIKADKNRRWYHIDGIVAVLMAFQRATANEGVTGGMPMAVQL